jgi:hypothetical protein
MTFNKISSFIMVIQIAIENVITVRSSIDTTSMHHSTMEKTQRLEGSKFVEPQYHIEEISKSKPIFVQPLSDPKPVNEGRNIHLECRLEPMGDPTMRVEWFYNGRPVTVGKSDIICTLITVIHK